MDDMRVAAERWIEGYLRAWRSNDPEDIAALFTEAAEYRFDAFSAPFVGREAIVAEWLRRQDEPDSFDFDYEVVGVDGTRAFVEGETTYRDGPTYSNLWVVELEEDGTASSFTEWWMDQSEPS